MTSIMPAAGGMRRKISITSAGTGAYVPQPIVKRRQFVGLGQFAVQNQIRHFFERGMLGQFFDGIAAIQQSAGDRADRRFAGNNAFEARAVKDSVMTNFTDQRKN